MNDILLSYKSRDIAELQRLMQKIEFVDVTYNTEDELSMAKQAVRLSRLYASQATSILERREDTNDTG